MFTPPQTRCCTLAALFCFLSQALKNLVSKSFGISSQVVRTNPSLYFKLQACLCLLVPPPSTPRKSPPTRRPLLAGAATPQTPPTTWYPPLHPNRALKSSRRRPLVGPPTFTRTTRRRRWRGWYVPRSTSCLLVHFSFSQY